jgi:transposase
MGMARYVVDAVLLVGRSAREVARAHGISKTWIYELISRYRAGSYEALEPRSRRPRSGKHETPREVVEAIVRLRSGRQGLQGQPSLRLKALQNRTGPGPQGTARQAPDRRPQHPRH